MGLGVGNKRKMVPNLMKIPTRRHFGRREAVAPPPIPQATFPPPEAIHLACHFHPFPPICYFSCV